MRGALRRVAIATGLALVVFDNRLELLRAPLFLAEDPARAARCLLQWLLAWAVVEIVARRRSLVREWRGLLLFAVSTGLCLLVVSRVGPFLLRKWLLPQYTLGLDHRPRPFTDGANEDGVYSPEASTAFRASDFNIVFLGDSFTANLAVPYAQRFPALVQGLLRERLSTQAIHTVNFGWVSSSPVLQARQLRAIGAKYAPDLVVQCVDLTDFHDDLQVEYFLRQRGLAAGQVTIFRLARARASFALGVPDISGWLRDRVAFLPPRAESPVPRDRWFFLRRPWQDTAYLLDATWRALLETRDVARSLGARYAVFAFPRYQQYDRNESPRDWEKRALPASDRFILEPFKFLQERSRGADFPLHVLLADFAQAGERPLSLSDDPHWNASGNRVAAEAIARYLAADALVQP